MANPFDILLRSIWPGQRRTLPPMLPQLEPVPRSRVDAIRRADAHGAPLVRQDGFANAAKKLGTSNDVTTWSRPVHAPALDIEHVAILYRRGLYPRLCQTLALWTWGDFRYQIVGLTPAQQEAINARMEETGFWTAMMDGDARGMGYGVEPVHAVLSSSGSHREDPTGQPLRASEVSEVFRFLPLNPRRTRPLELEQRRENPRYLMPALWRVKPNSVAGFTPSPYDLDGSRTILHYGIPDDQVNNQMLFTGLWQGAPRPWADQLWGSLRSIEMLYRGLDRAALETIIHVFTIMGDEADLGADLDMGDGSTPALQARMEQIADQMSTSRKVVLREGEDLRAVVADFKAVSELVMAMYLRMRSEAAIPAVLLTGDAPSGLSTDEKSWWTQWAKRIMQRRKQRAVPILRQVIPWFMAEQGIRVSDWRIELGPLSEMSEDTLAEIRERHTRADVMLLQAGVLTPDEVRQRESGGGFITTLTLDPEERGEDPTEALEAFTLALERMSQDSARMDANLPSSVAEMTFDVPQYMQRNAELGLELREKFGRGMPAPEGGGPATGVLTANDLISGTISAERVMLMEDWFARHYAPSQLKGKRGAKGWQDLENPSNGWIAALGWGDDGDGRAKEWVDRQAEKVRKAIEATKKRADADFSGKALISARLSEQGVKRWRELLGEVEDITGRLQGYDPEDDGIQEAPHVTVLYLGAVDPKEFDEIAEVMQEEAKGWRPEMLHLRRVKTLPSGPVSNGRTPVVAEVHAWVLHELHHTLLRKLAHLVRAKQFHRYEQHVTLGFAPEVDGDTLVALEEFVPRPSDYYSAPGPVPDDADLPEPMGALGEVVLTYGDKVIARAPFEGRRDSDEAMGYYLEGWKHGLQDGDLVTSHPAVRDGYRDARRCLAILDEDDPSTPAEPSERVKGSAVNAPGVASKATTKIKVPERVVKALRAKVEEHNEDHEAQSKTVTLGMLKAVYQRGVGAYSTSHRPSVKSREQWGLARVNAFLHLVSKGRPKNRRYIQDNDLLPDDHPRKPKE